MKLCRICGDKKHESLFYPSNANLDGLRGECKNCGKREKRLYKRIAKNKEEASSDINGLKRQLSKMKKLNDILIEQIKEKDKSMSTLNTRYKNIVMNQHAESIYDSLLHKSKSP